jgi:hypothetical protein
MSLEFIIYFTGYAFIITTLLLLTGLFGWGLTLVLRQWLIHDLKSTYNHMQLAYEMGKLTGKNQASFVNKSKGGQ